MSARTFVNQAELKRLAALATSQGVQVEIEFDGRVIRITPNSPAGNKGEVVVPSGGIPL